MEENVSYFLGQVILRLSFLFCFCEAVLWIKPVAQTASLTQGEIKDLL